MKINLSSSDLKHLEKLLQIKNYNIAAADCLFEYCFQEGTSSNIDDYLEELRNYLDIDLNIEEDKYFYQNFIKPSISIIDTNLYYDNPYVKAIHPREEKYKEYSLEYITINSLQLMPYNDIQIVDDFREISALGYSLNPYTYLSIAKNGNVWMSLDINEINTMSPYIEKCHGNIITYGLGLGYFPFMVALKDNVKSVTVIEKDQNIIDLFNQCLLPYFPHKEKIKIIKMDAFKFSTGENLKPFDYLFIDIWHNAEDGLPLYLKFHHLLKNIPIRVDYWLKESILAMLRRCVLTIIEEKLQNYSDDNYRQSKNDYDRIINSLYWILKPIKIDSIQQIVDLLKNGSLEKMDTFNKR